MAQNKFLDLSGLTLYDEKIKKYAEDLGVNYDPAGTAQTKVDELAKGEVASLREEKADKATTLEGYGIQDAYTKAQADSAIATAVANADHLKRAIVDALPTVDEADEHTIYMVAKKTPSGENSYDEYMLVISGETKKLEKIGDSAVDLTDYATKEEVATAKSEAISTAAGDATSKADKALSDAKAYSDSLSKNYATAAQGAKADTALQKASITSGKTNGTISVSGTDVAVKGLGSAAYAATSAFDAAGTAQTKVQALADGTVKTNTDNIANLTSRMDAFEQNTSTITEEEINALFQ